MPRRLLVFAQALTLGHSRVLLEQLLAIEQYGNWAIVNEMDLHIGLEDSCGHRQIALRQQAAELLVQLIGDCGWSGR